MILRLLEIEGMKNWKNKASRALILIYFLLITLLALLPLSDVNAEINGFKFGEQGIFDFPYIWHLSTYLAAVLKFFLAIVMVSMMANEYSYGTLKQNLIDGLSKQEFITSKFLMLTFLSLLSTIYIFLLSLTIGLFFAQDTSISLIFSELEYFVAYFVKLVGFFSFCLFLGIVVKRSAFALGFLIVWNIIEGIISAFLHFKFFPTGTTAKTIAGFLPLEAMSNLIVEPFTRLELLHTISTQMGGDADKNYGVPFLSVGIVLMWTVLFVFGSFKILEKRDL